MLRLVWFLSSTFDEPKSLGPHWGLAAEIFDMTNDCTVTATASPLNRSAISNGSRMHAPRAVDGRSASARRFRDLVRDLGQELGLDRPSAAEQNLLRQAAALSLRAEQLQAAVARGDAVDADTLIRLASTSQRILAGLRKRTRASAPPTLAEHLARRAAERAAERVGETPGEAA